MLVTRWDLPPREPGLVMDGYHLPRGEIMDSSRNQQRSYRAGIMRSVMVGVLTTHEQCDQSAAINFEHATVAEQWFWAYLAAR